MTTQHRPPLFDPAAAGPPILSHDQGAAAMTDTTTDPQAVRIPYCHKIRYGITGAPILTEDEMDGSHAPGVGVDPTLIELIYSAARDGKPASVGASVTGWWTRFGVREQPERQVTTHFKDGPDGWPGWLAEEARRHDPDATAVPSAPADRAALSAKLWKIAEHHIVAEWICCEPLDPKHELCAKGHAALGMARTLLVDSDPEKAWNPEAPVLDAVLAEMEQLRRQLASSERTRENADFHLGQEMARRQLAEKETARLRAVVARLRQMTDHWEQQLPEVIRTPAVVSAIRAALEAADEAQQPTPCSQPNPCEDGELCGVHEVEQAHADGEHEYCGVTCEVEFPSDKLRNTILYRAIPGSAGMLDELLRRAATGQEPQS